MLSQPTISIGLPVYNGERYLEQSIESLLSQSFEDFELIISDNASTDRSAAICQRFAKKDKRIRYYRNPINLGAAPNYNRVFALSSGRYFKWASSDDVHAPQHLRRCLEMLETSPADVVLCYPKTVLIDENGNEVEKYEDKMDIRHGRPQDRLRHVFQNLRLCNAVFGLIRADVLAVTSLIGGYFGSDNVLLAELSLHGKFREIPDYLLFRRMHQGCSRQANSTAMDVAAWFDVNNRGKLILPQCKYFFEYLKVIGRSPLTWGQQIGCYGVFVNEWVARYWKHMGGECKILLRHKLGLLRQA
jgi:glycosyltransferase involved in cell wall biosynthesis